MNTEWRFLADNNNYMVSNYGKVKSISRYRTGRGTKKYLAKEIILSPFISNTGYKRVNIGKKHFSIHRLVAIAFIDNPENKEMVNHKDGNRLNNKKSNLEWNTNSENQLHAVRLGLKVGLKGANNPCSHSVYTINIETGEKLFHGSVHEASRLTGISKQSLLQWLHGKHKPSQKQKIRVYYNETQTV